MFNYIDDHQGQLEKTSLPLFSRTNMEDDYTILMMMQLSSLWRLQIIQLEGC